MTRKMLIDEATVKLALEALEDLIPLCDPGFSVCYDVNKAITALREALTSVPDWASEAKEQPAPATELREQEPVAWMYPSDYERMTTSETFCTVYSVEVGSATRGETTVALYTSPPALSLAQRQARSADTWVNATTWRGLTDEELSEVYNQADWDTVNGWEYERAIEARLRSKNEDRN